ncbi:MAG: BolA family transcriptional regulator [Arenimonas sp.]|nr:BolA family transcriptional regulator [Arenimonas sp.]
MARVHLIEQALQVLEPFELRIRDDSHKHAGHAGASDGRGHFSMVIVSRQFEGLSLLQRHKLVYRALASLMDTDIHAMAIQAKTPFEAAQSR